MSAFLLLLASFAVILVGALVFTNAVEWAGHKLELGQGAVGSLLAAVGTAMPETLIPIVAIIGGAEVEDVAVSAIIGAPFLLATIAMALVGTSALIYRNKREQGTERAHAPTLERDLVFFLIFFALGVAVGAVDLPRRSRSADPRLRDRVRVLRAAHALGRRRDAGGRRDPARFISTARRTRRIPRAGSSCSSSSSASARSSAAPTSSSRSFCTSPRKPASSRWSSR